MLDDLLEPLLLIGMVLFLGDLVIVGRLAIDDLELVVLEALVAPLALSGFVAQSILLAGLFLLLAEVGVV